MTRRGPVQLPEDPEKVREQLAGAVRALEAVDLIAADMERGSPNHHRAATMVERERRRLDQAETALGHVEGLEELRELLDRVAGKLGID